MSMGIWSYCQISIEWQNNCMLLKSSHIPSMLLCRCTLEMQQSKNRTNALGFMKHTMLLPPPPSHPVKLSLLLCPWVYVKMHTHFQIFITGGERVSSKMTLKKAGLYSLAWLEFKKDCITSESLTWSRTMISSASTTVDNLCAIKTDVLCFTTSLMALKMFCKIKDMWSIEHFMPFRAEGPS